MNMILMFHLNNDYSILSRHGGIPFVIRYSLFDIRYFQVAKLRFQTARWPSLRARHGTTDTESRRAGHRARHMTTDTENPRAGHHARHGTTDTESRRAGHHARRSMTQKSILPGIHYGFYNFGIAGTSAEVTDECVSNLFFTGFW